MHTRSRSRRPVFFLVGGLIIAALVVGGLIRYNGPVATVRSYFNDLGLGKYSDAVALACPSQQSDANSGLQVLEVSQARVDAAQITYDLQDESLTVAHVHAHGTLSVSVNLLGQKLAIPTALDTTFTVQSSGIGWCLNSSSFSINPAGLGAVQS